MAQGAGRPRRENPPEYWGTSGTRLAASVLTMVHVFGLTGGIGSGKSTVARRFAARALCVIDADVLAREVVAPGAPALAEIVEAFGQAMLDPDGHLDRARLAAVVFDDAEKRARLNQITHPRVRELSVQRVSECGARGEPLCCYEVPLLVESGMADALRPLVVVSVPVEVQVARTCARDGMSEAQARARIAAQMPLADKVAIADYVIDNSGTLERTHEQADEVLDAILSGLKIPRERYALG